MKELTHVLYAFARTSTLRNTSKMAAYGLDPEPKHRLERISINELEE